VAIYLNAEPLKITRTINTHGLLGAVKADLAQDERGQGQGLALDLLVTQLGLFDLCAQALELGNEPVGHVDTARAALGLSADRVNRDNLLQLLDIRVLLHAVSNNNTVSRTHLVCIDVRVERRNGSVCRTGHFVFFLFFSSAKKGNSRESSRNTSENTETTEAAGKTTT